MHKRSAKSKGKKNMIIIDLRSNIYWLIFLLHKLILDSHYSIYIYMYNKIHRIDSVNVFFALVKNYK